MAGERPTSAEGETTRRKDGLDTILSALPAMSLAELHGLWSSVGEGEPPCVSEALLCRLVAQRMQEKRHGSLPPRALRALQRAANRVASLRPSRKHRAPGAGTRLIREWNGQTVTVHVQEDGFLWEGRHYGSLSAIAREVTGAQWSGPRFFGLRAGG